MIGETITLYGYGAYYTMTKNGTVKKVTKTQVVVQYGNPNPERPEVGTCRYRLRTGYLVGGNWNMSGYQIPLETLVKLRDVAPK